ncbi:hypothetical protein [Formosa haliotis]|uniref:hypothetical protein n=1 Tax=Formosa haliotis TaxID=1555194 RepID=UPI0008247610|nr:hypothetical protein [Formosa haliotis]
MKKIMILALVLISFNALAQDQKGERKGKHNKEMRMQRPDFTPEQQATLQTKKMTLKLDLTESQQKEIYNLNIAQAKSKQADREAFKKAKDAGKKPTQEDRYNRMVAQLDHQIAMKNKMKSILKSDQYELWEKSMKQRKGGRQHNEGRPNGREQHGRRG